MRTALFFVLILIWASFPALADGPAGFRKLTVANTTVRVWYPAAQSVVNGSAGPITMVAENKVFVGVPVIEDAPLEEKPHPLAILSHGYSGLWRNQAWLAERMAREGFIVASFNHAGTSFNDMKDDWAKNLTERPHQVSTVLTALLKGDVLGSQIDRQQISVVGHSLGGSTALMLAGGEFDPARLLDACGEDETKLVCTTYRKGGLDRLMAPASAVDDRIASVVLLELEGIRGFTPESLRALDRPVLALVAGMEDPALPIDWEGRQQAALLPASISRYAEVIGATHFSFMSQCKPGAEELLADEAFVCSGETLSREQLHETVAGMVISFLRSGRTLVSALQTP
ncbi:alpha/beta fold hydrolase [uncultured Cohaesibacter sp.]|uniref:alpha/beta hydrolase family protein n=1 Tax=uncultured Cohaesibacter sp. TaxID=1002546 RepID=UPI0029C83E32|nr:alpha/beta fold hydrolase [uncultured Cohaesibacter sp.]